MSIFLQDKYYLSFISLMTDHSDHCSVSSDMIKKRYIHVRFTPVVTQHSDFERV